MIKIKIDNENLDLKENLIIPLELNFDLVDYTKIRTSKIFSIEIPLTKKNKRLTKYPNTNNFNFIEGFIILNSNVYSSTKIKVKGILEHSLQIELVLGDNFFYESIKSKLITTIDPDYVNRRSSVDTINRAFPESDISHPYLNLKDYSVNFGGNNTTPLGGTQGFFYVGFVLEQIFNFYGFGIENSIFRNDEVLKRLTIVWVEKLFRASIHNNTSFFLSLPRITVDLFFSELVNLLDITFVFDNLKKTVEIKKIIDVLKNSDLIIDKDCYITDFKIIPHENKIKRIKFETEHTFTSFGEEINLVESVINLEGDDLIIKLNHEKTIPDDGGVGSVNYTLQELHDLNKFILAFVNESTREVVFDSSSLPFSHPHESDSTLQVENFVTNHFLHTFKKDRFLFTNSSSHKAECMLYLRSGILSSLKKGSKIKHNNNIYLITKLAGNLTGKEVEILKAELINI